MKYKRKKKGAISTRRDEQQLKRKELEKKAKAIKRKEETRPKNSSRA